MSDKFIRSAISESQKRFEMAQTAYNNSNNIIENNVSASIYSTDQILAARNTVKKSIEITKRFHEECEAIIIALDTVCRPYLQNSIDICVVGDVVTLLNTITKEMQEASTNITVSGNGIYMGELGTVSAEASKEVKAILQVWELHYRAMPGYQADLQRIKQAKIDKKNDLIDDIAQSILLFLKREDWVPATEIHAWNLGDKKDVSRAITKLVSENRIQRLEQKYSVLFALPGSPAPVEEPEKTEEPTPPLEKEPIVTESNPVKKKRSWIIILVAVLALLATVVCITVIKKKQEEQTLLAEQQRLDELVASAIDATVSAINNMDVSFMDFDVETKAALQEAKITYIFEKHDVRLAIVKKLATLYKENKLSELIDFFAFLSRVGADRFVGGTYNPTDTTYDVCFTSEFIESFRTFVSENGVSLESSSHIMDEYAYNGFQFGFYKDVNDPREERFYIKVYGLESPDDFKYIIISGEIYRRVQNEQYDNKSPGYFLVGETFELVEEEIKNSEDITNKYYPAATCPKCGNSFRANTMRAEMIAKYGYCGMGLCNKDR